MRLRRLSAVVRGPRLLAAALVLVLAYLFATNLTPRPRFVVQTEAKLEHDNDPVVRCLCGPAFWGTMEAVSEEGYQVTVGVHHGDLRFPHSRWEVRDARTGADRTPAHWNDPDWQQFLRGWYTDTSGLTDLLSHPSGRDFLHDDAAWAALRKRLAVGRAKHVEDIRQTVRPVRDEETCGGPFPNSLRFSPDGRLVTYVTRHGWPVHLVSESMGDGTVIEEVRTGRRVGMLPAVVEDIKVAPGGRTAVSRNFPKEQQGEQPYLILWDLETSVRRAELFLPDYGGDIRYSPDGRYVFADPSRLIRWWDTATGKQVGEIYSSSSYHLADGGRALVIQSDDDQTLHFWDVPTGRELGDWEPGRPPGTTGKLGRLLASGGDRYFAARLDPDQSPTPALPFVDRLLQHLPVGGASREEGRIVLLDVTERRVLGPVPGEHAALSSDGHWLATLDADGVVRVWPVPFGRPWARGLAYAAAIVFGGWGAWRLLGKLRRRVRRTRAD